MALLRNISWQIFRNSIVLGNRQVSWRFISTGKKTESTEVCEPQQGPYKNVPDFSKPLENKNWVSYGFSETDKGDDRFKAHFVGFCFFSYMLCGFTFLYIYCPDKTRNDWARREAFIRIHEREELGLEIIDPNYVDPSKIVLPPDEELSEDDIVI